MDKITFHDPKNIRKDFNIALPRIPCKGEFVVIGGRDFRIDQVRFCFGDGGTYSHCHLEVSEGLLDVEDVLEDA